MNYKVYMVNGEEIDVPPNQEKEFLKMNPGAKSISVGEGGPQVNLQTGEVTVPGKPQGTNQSQNNQQLNTESSSEKSLSESQKKNKPNREGYSDFTELPSGVRSHLDNLPSDWDYADYEKHAGDLTEEYGSASPARKAEIDNILEQLEKKEDYLRNIEYNSSNLENAEKSINKNEPLVKDTDIKSSKEFVNKINKPMPKVGKEITDAGNWFNAEQNAMKLLTDEENGYMQYGFTFEEAVGGASVIRVMSEADIDGNGEPDSKTFNVNNPNAGDEMDRWMRKRAQDPVSRLEVINKSAQPNADQKQEAVNRYNNVDEKTKAIIEIFGLPEDTTAEQAYEFAKKHETQQKQYVTQDLDEGYGPGITWPEEMHENERKFNVWAKDNPELAKEIFGTTNAFKGAFGMKGWFDDAYFSDYQLKKSSEESLKLNKALEQYAQENPDVDINDLYDDDGYAKDQASADILNYVQENIVPNIEISPEELEGEFNKQAMYGYYEDNIAKEAQKLGQKWFIKSGVQKDIEAEAVEVRDEVQEIGNQISMTYDEYEQNANALRNISNDINTNYTAEKVDEKVKELKEAYGVLSEKDFNKRVNEIKSRFDLTTQSGVDGANAVLTDFQQSQQEAIDNLNNDSYFTEYKDKINQFNHIQDNVIPLQEENIKKLQDKLDKDYALSENEYVSLAKVLGQNHDFGTVLAQEFKHAVIDLGQTMVIDVGDMIVSGASLVTGHDTKNFKRDNPALDAYSKLNTQIKTKEQIRAEENFLGRFSMDINEYQERSRETYRAPVRFDEIDGVGDAGEWALTTLVTQAPQLALMAYTGGTSSLYYLGASSAGAKWRELNDQRNLFERTGGLYGHDLSFASMYANAIFTGVAEGASERITLGQVKRAKGFLKGTADDMYKLGFKNGLRKNVFDFKSLKKNGGIYLNDSFQEGFSEVVAQVSSNVADIASGTMDASEIFEGVPESFASGWVVSNGIKVPGALKSLTKPFRSKDTNQRVGEISDRLKELSIESANPDITKERFNEIQTEMANLVNESGKIMQNDIARIDAMNKGDKKSLIKIEQDNYKDRKRAEEIQNDKTLTPKQKSKELSGLQRKVNRRNETKDKILNKYPPEMVDANYKRKIRTMQQMANLAKEHGAPEVNIREVNGKEFSEGRSQHEQNMSRENIEKVSKANKGLIKALQSIIKDKDSTPQEKKDAQAMLKDAKQQVSIADNLLRTSDNGVMQPKFDDKGNITGIDIMINKDAIIKNGKLNTAAHEFIHATFANTLKFDPQMREILGQKLMDILTNDKNVSFKSEAKRREFYKRVAAYNTNQQGEEMLAIAAEMLIDGDIIIKKTGLQKLADLFNRFVNVMFGYDMKLNDNQVDEITFDSVDDIKKFLVLYKDSIENNKPSPAIAKMLAKGANGKMFKDARTPKERKDQSSFSKNIDAVEDKNPDWKGSFDSFTQNPDGTPKYETKEDFQMSDDFWPAMTEIMNSKPLRNLIQSGVASETGIDSQQEMDDFVRQTLENIQDRFMGGLTKKARNEIKKIEEQRAKGELTAKETAEAVDKIKNNPKNNKKGFDPSATNGSLFGWLTGVAGGAGKSVIYRARGDVMNKYKRTVEKGAVSTEKQIGEGRTIADVISDKKSNLIKSIDEADMTPRLKDNTKSEVNELVMIMEEMGLDKNVIDAVMESISDSNIPLETILDNKQSVFKNIRDLLINVSRYKGGKVQTSRKFEDEDKVSSEKEASPEGVLFPVLEAISAEFGVDPLRILAKQDLDGQQRKSAQDFIFDKFVKEDGSFNYRLLNALMAKGYDSAGRSTFIAKGGLKVFYNKMQRAGGVNNETGAGLRQQDRKPVITKQEFLNRFGVNEDGSKVPGTKNDGAIRELVIQVASLAANQSIIINSTENQLALPSDIARLSEGKAETAFSFGEYGKLPKQFEKKNVAPRVIATTGQRTDSNGKVLEDRSSEINIIDRDAKSPYHKKMTVGQHMDQIHNRFHKFSDNKHYQTIMDTVSGGIKSQSYGTKEEYNRYVEDTESKQSYAGRQNITSKKRINKNFLKNFNKKVNDSRLDVLYEYGKDVERYLQKYPNDAWAFALMVSDTVNNQSGAYTRINIPTGFYLTDKSGNPDLVTLVMEEHTSPQKLIANVLFNAARFGKVDKVFPVIRAIAMQGALAETDDKAVGAAGFGNNLPPIFYSEVLPLIENGKLDKEIMDLGLASMIRYAIPLVNKKTGEIVYINLNKYKMMDGRTIPEVFGVGIKGTPSKAEIKLQNTLIQMILTGKITKAEAKEIMKKSPSKFLQSIEKNLQVRENVTKAGVLSLQQNSMLSKGPVEVKGMSTFDFDDTLGVTKSGVRVRVPNPDGQPKPSRKVIFLAGGAGSGKSNVVSKLNLEKQGFKLVNSDISLEWLKKNSGLPADMRDLTREQLSKLGKLQHQSRGIARRKMMKYQGNADGVVVDGTGGSTKSMQKLVDEFKSKGYDVSMLFVETSLDTALERNRARKERSLLDKIVERNHQAVQNNKSDFANMFGDTFMEVNTDNLNINDSMPIELVNKMNQFVSSYEKLRLDAAEFAEQGDSILEAGGNFDFSEFNEVVEGRPGPLLGKALERAKKYGTKDMFVLTARPQQSAKAIHEFLKSQGLNIPIENITGLADSTGDAKAAWMLNKFAEGYNDMYFVDDALQNVEAVKDVLNQLDIKSKVIQAKLNNVNKLVEPGSESMLSKVINPGNVLNPKDPMDKEFNDMLERRFKIKSDKVVYSADAKKLGGKFNLGRFLKNLYIPPSAEDFKGLIYGFIGKGKQGEADLKFFAEKLFKPFAEGIRNWNASKQGVVDDYNALRKNFPNVRKTLRNKVKGTNFTVDTAIRVYLWDKAGFDIPGIDPATRKALLDYVNNNPNIMNFADILSTITKRPEGYIEPDENWMVGTIGSDLRNLVDNVSRKEFISEFINNKDIIMSPDNLNKIESIHGTEFREALEDILFRMENGTNRLRGSGRIVNMFTEWINGSVGAIMFVNMRSALLQNLSIVNFINWSDNNIFKAAAAFANQKQFWKDFTMLFNSPMLKQRRKGLQTDVSASELTKSFAENGYNPRTVINYLLQKGFLPTQIVDSFAIAFGGASMYRNRFNKYVKQGMNSKQAHEQAMLEWQEVGEETQQSSRPDLVSQQQAGPLGRLVLAFQNVTMQYGRLTKKALADLVNGRGDWKTNVSKILYYGAIQNVIFAGLQSALAFALFGDDEEEIENRTQRTFNQALDSFLRGTGLYGALISTLKNTVIQWKIQQDKPWGKERLEKIGLEVVNLSPPIGSKLRKIYNAYYAEKYNKGVSEELGFRVENPKLKKWSSLIEATTNIPLARIMNKANNLEEAITGQHETWKRVALVLGWNMWDLQIEDKELEDARDKAEVKQKEIRKQEKIEEKKAEQEEKRRQGYRTVRCSGTNSSGSRCGMTTETKARSWKCMHHMEFRDGMDRDGDGVKEYQCKATTSSGRRCRNKTENRNKKCYAHQ